MSKRAEPLGKARPLDAVKDLDQLGALIEIAFSGELSRRGTDIREELRSIRRLIPILKALGRISESFRHLIDGFVWEEDGRIVGSVMTSRMGNEKTRWYIGAVATHPDYRRRGIARRLLGQAIEHARTHGADVCVLDVRADNVPAYTLYESFGFVPYDGKSEFKLERIPEGIETVFSPSYTIRRWGLGEWRVSYNLALSETPKRAQEFLPISEDTYRITPVQRAMVPLLTRIQGIEPHRHLVEHEGTPVAAMRLIAQERNKGTHELQVWFDPAHRRAVARPLISHGLRILKDYPKRNTLITVNSEFQDLIDVLKSLGFVEIETLHRLGLKFSSE